MSDELLAEVALGCRRLQSISLSNCSAVTDAGVRGLAAGCPALLAFVADDVGRLTDGALLALGDSCKRLQVRVLSTAPAGQLQKMNRLNWRKGIAQSLQKSVDSFYALAGQFWISHAVQCKIFMCVNGLVGLMAALHQGPVPSAVSPPYMRLLQWRRVYSSPSSCLCRWRLCGGATRSPVLGWQP